MASKIILLLFAAVVAASAMPPQHQTEVDPEYYEVVSEEVSEEDLLLLEDMLNFMESEEDEQRMVELLAHETDPRFVRAATEAIKRRMERSGGCYAGLSAKSPFCVFLRERAELLAHGRPGVRFGASAGVTGGAGADGGSSGAAGVSVSGSTAFTVGGDVGSGSGTSSGSSSGSASSSSSSSSSGSASSSSSSGSGSGSATGPRGGFGVVLEPSYSHDACLPPVTHVIREAIEYLPKTIYNTQHLILPSTRVLTMVETEGYPQPVYETVTTTLAQPDQTITATAVRQTEKTLDVNSARQTDVLLRSTKLHVFTDTKDYFWTKTEFQPYYETVTTTTTSDVKTDFSHAETRYEDHTAYVTTTVPHVVTSTSTSSTVVRSYVTETAHQYRYVAVTPVPVTVTETVTHCF